MTAKAQLLETMRSERQLWNDVVAQIGSAHMTQAGVAGYWSAKDVVAHITAYERWLAEWLEAASRHEFPVPSVLDDADVDHRNRRIYEAAHALPLENILQESQSVFERLLSAIEVLPDDYIIDAQRAEWFMKPYWSKMKTVPEAVANLSYGHYHEHLPDLQRWLETLEK